VSYDKLKQHEQAIATGLRCQALKADRYESEANLGTFYIHAGQPERGLEHLRRAVHINPDAHFGREKYQIRLVEFVSQQKKEDSSKAPIRKDTLLDLVLLLTDTKQNKNRQEAVKGIAGMLHFGNHDSPILLSAMGAALADPLAPTEDGKMLGCRAFLRASYLVNDPEMKEEYRKLAKDALYLQVKITNTEEQMPLEDIEKSLQQELKEAENWIAQVRADELSWINEGKDVEAEFGKKYYQEPEISDHEDVTVISPALGMVYVLLLPLALVVGFILMVITVVWLGARNKGRWAKIN
jgi:tetratricopeptide (TPR) repeat protein